MANNNNTLSSNIEWAITDTARGLVKKLTGVGLDADLALALVERILPEPMVYNLPGTEDDIPLNGDVTDER